MSFSLTMCDEEEEGKKRRIAVKKWILSVCNEKQIKAEEDEKISVAVTTTQVFWGEGRGERP